MFPRIGEVVKKIGRAAILLTAQPFGTVMSGSPRSPAVALTFDDGPDPLWTPPLLDLLEAHGARATFFVIGKEAARHREILERAAESGHAFGNHTWDHPSLPLAKGKARRAQLRWCREVLGALDCGLFRPPYGHQSLGSHLDALFLGYQTVAWSALAEDWKGDPAETLVDRVARRLQPGSIVLFHDRLATTTEARFRDRAPTLSAVETLLTRYKDTYRFVTLPELLRLGRPRRRLWYQRPNLEMLRRQI